MEMKMAVQPSLTQWALLTSVALISIKAAIPECTYPQRCGNVSIPYPFGITGTGCGLEGFQILCKTNSTYGRGSFPFLPTPSGDLQVLNISTERLLINSSAIKTSNCSTAGISLTSFQIPPEGPFTISDSNKFVAVGCRALGMFGFNDWGGCVSICKEQIDVSVDTCTGKGCCTQSIPPNYTQFDLSVSNIDLSNLSDYKNSPLQCSISTILDPDSLTITKSSIENFQNGHYYMSLDWAIGNGTSCPTTKAANSYSCALNAECFPAARGSGYVCNCSRGYSGDGYRNGTGCQDINECNETALNHCHLPPRGRCENTPGSYKCYCIKGRGDGTTVGTGCQIHNWQGLPVIIGVGTTVAVLLTGFFFLFCGLSQRKSRNLKKKYFQLNGGFHLQELISSRRGGEGTRIFSSEELEKATNKFAESLVLGTGGYGTVYKGTLAEGTVVAIKKAKEVDQKENGQFINEVAILSQINHRNVVKLLGCCLETAVPLLVYEYVSNGTLSEHLNGKREGHLGWEDRLRIACETAEALAYLHSAASISIVHRDVKSSNILLDEKCTPKVADFGVSKLVPMGQTHITTVVQGTMGYLDPEYFQTVQLTEKSDVYSFGVVLVELLTSMKPVSYERSKKDSNLAIFFLSTLKMNRLMEIIDSRLVVDENGAEVTESMHSVAALARDCLSVDGQKRPSMKEVVQELLWIRAGRPSGRARAWLDAVPENDDEIVALIGDGERSDENRASELLDSLAHNLSISFNIETGVMNHGR